MLGKEGKGLCADDDQTVAGALAQAIRSATVVETIIDYTLRYTARRSAFGQKIADFQNTQFKLAELKTKGHRCACLHRQVHRSSWRASSIRSTPRWPKMFTSGLHCETVDQCLQLFGAGATCRISNRQGLCRRKGGENRRRLDRDHEDDHRAANVFAARIYTLQKNGSAS